MPPTEPSTRLSLFTTAATAVATALILISSTAFAQSTSAPVPVAFGGYTSDGEKTLYIRGGSTTGADNNIQSTGQFFALDLQTSWTTSSPAWRSLTSSTGVQMNATVYNSLAMTGPHTMIEWSVNPGITIFDLKSYSSTSSPYPSMLTNEYFGLSIAVDPTTGTAYVPCGYNAGREMVRYTPGENAIKSEPMPTTGELLTMGSYTFVWSSIRSSFLLFGGYTSANPPVCNHKMWEYKTGSWASLPIPTAPFTDVVDHCMVPAMGGANMIMFGGQRPTATSYQVISGIYILDTATMTWRTGTAAPAQEARRGMACTVSGDYFIAWGGTNGTVMGAKPLVYNMKTNQWVDQFVAPLPSGATTGGSNIGAIAGGVGGVVGLIAIILGYVFYRRRQQQKAKETDDSETKDKEAEKEGPKAGKPGDDLKKDPQGNNISITALEARTMNNNVLGGDEGAMVVDKDGRVVSRNPQSFIHTATRGLRDPQYQYGAYPSSTNAMHQNNPQYFEPGTQFQDMPLYPTIANNPQLYASSPYAMGVSGGVQSQDFSYPPVPPLAAMRRDSKARIMSGITSNTGNIGGAAAPMTEEILNLQIALVKAQQEQQFQLQQQNLARFRAEQEAQLQMLQQQLRATSSSSSPSMTNALSAPVPTVSPLMSPSSLSMSAPVLTVGSEPPSSSLSSPMSATTMVAVDMGSKTDAPLMDYVPAPVFAPTPAPSNATSEATTFVTSAPVSTVTSPDSDDTFVKPSSAVSAPVVTRL